MEASEEDTKGYHSSSNDGLMKTIYEERSKLKHKQENTTTATLVSGPDDDFKANKSAPMIATETRKVAYTETKVWFNSN